MFLPRVRIGSRDLLASLDLEALSNHFFFPLGIGSLYRFQFLLPRPDRLQQCSQLLGIQLYGRQRTRVVISASGYIGPSGQGCHFAISDVKQTMPTHHPLDLLDLWHVESIVGSLSRQDRVRHGQSDWIKGRQLHFELG